MVQEQKVLEGEAAAQALKNHFEAPFADRPTVRVITNNPGLDRLLNGVIICNHVLKNPGEENEHSIFYFANLVDRKSGQPLAQRFAWPPEHMTAGVSGLYPLEAIEIL